MPWKKDTLPDAVKALPEHAQEIWLKAANSAMEEDDDDKKAIATAWEAVKKGGYEKGDDGKWHKAEKHSEKDVTDEFTEDDKSTAVKLLKMLKASFTPEKKADKYAEVKQTGKPWGLALRRVALQGADVPSLKTLKDIETAGPNGDIADVEIFEAGIHTSASGQTKRYTEEDLEHIAQNFQGLKDVVKPPVVLGHDEDQAMLKAEGLPAAGWVDDVRRMGSKLVASFKNVPEAVRKAIENRRYTRVSAELYPNFVFGEEKQESIVLDSKAEGGGENVKTFTEGEVKQIVDEAVEKATLKYRETVATLKGERDEAVKGAEKTVATQRKQRIEDFTETRKKEGFPPALLDDLGFNKFAESLESTEVVKFSEGDGAKEETQLDWFLRYTEEIEKRAKKGESFLVPKGERAPGRENHEEFSEGEMSDKKAEAHAERIVGHETGGTKKKDE